MIKNKYLNQLINKYESTNLWDIRVGRVPEKYFYIPVMEWLNIINNPYDNNCEPAYRPFSEYAVQGVYIVDKKYFLYECTCRYKNTKDVTYYTFINISKFSHNDSIGYSNDYCYIRGLLDDSNKKTFSNHHTYLAYSILRTYPNFSDISSYNDFISRYVGINGKKLCEAKKTWLALQVPLSKTLKDEVDFKQLSWESYSEASSGIPKADLFYHDTSKTYTDKYTSIILDGGIVY